MTDWEKELEQILVNRVLDITNEYKGVKRTEGIQVYLGYPAALIKELSDFIAQQRAKAVQEGKREAIKDVLKYGEVALEPENDYRDYYIVRINKMLLDSMSITQEKEEE